MKNITFYSGKFKITYLSFLPGGHLGTAELVVEHIQNTLGIQRSLPIQLQMLM